MGTLIVPSRGSIYVDANIIIYRVEDIQPFVAAMAPLWDALDKIMCLVTTSELSVLEVLVKLVQQGNMALQTLFHGVMFHTPNFTCIPITRQILQAAAQLRATTGLKTSEC
ncbi:MAG: hypothetical protein H0X37_06615 [Herpetosiphonaceae bacterium]|nr:hypothetical protein [Herpetosiphonaceae bacterium]